MQKKDVSPSPIQTPPQNNTPRVNNTPPPNQVDFTNFFGSKPEQPKVEVKPEIKNEPKPIPAPVAQQQPNKGPGGLTGN